MLSNVTLHIVNKEDSSMIAKENEGGRERGRERKKETEKEWKRLRDLSLSKQRSKTMGSFALFVTPRHKVLIYYSVLHAFYYLHHLHSLLIKPFFITDSELIINLF